jgi:hypothetical protein
MAVLWLLCSVVFVSLSLRVSNHMRCPSAAKDYCIVYTI